MAEQRKRGWYPASEKEHSDHSSAHEERRALTAETGREYRVAHTGGGLYAGKSSTWGVQVFHPAPEGTPPTKSRKPSNAEVLMAQRLGVEPRKDPPGDADILTGPKGGRYYVSSRTGEKVYVK